MIRRALALVLFVAAASASAQSFPIDSVCSRNGAGSFYILVGDYYSCTYVTTVPVEANGRLYQDIGGPWGLADTECYWPRQDWIARYQTAHNGKAPIPAPPGCANPPGRYAVAQGGSLIGFSDSIGGTPVMPTHQPFVEPYPADQGALTPTPNPTRAPGTTPRPTATPDPALCPGGEIRQGPSGCYCSTTFEIVTCPGAAPTHTPEVTWTATPTETATATLTPPTSTPTPESESSPIPTTTYTPSAAKSTPIGVPNTPLPPSGSGGGCHGKNASGSLGAGLIAGLVIVAAKRRSKRGKL